MRPRPPPSMKLVEHEGQHKLDLSSTMDKHGSHGLSRANAVRRCAIRVLVESLLKCTVLIFSNWTWNAFGDAQDIFTSHRLQRWCLKCNVWSRRTAPLRECGMVLGLARCSSPKSGKAQGMRPMS